MTTEAMPRLLSPPEAAHELGIALSAVQYRLSMGRFPEAFRVGSRWVIPAPIVYEPGKPGKPPNKRG